ncbi:pilus assembly PilX N-terminal domain-containing protein [Cupriavidus basilensis]|uniref:Pilus assembly PilX N-terminal domain-containing protein n=1 Tax=Cupriavidus basilensis TaxID=68895 RepID=A0ABT6APS8_9BURK|nr:PilX N-terminal domain-containing pilus assembly protein [Cupriavidus basilensis]MDF3834620.1 pilus assembly PilX N-terminal domain-containing protein [Cupriavidus basilensis]
MRRRLFQGGLRQAGMSLVVGLVMLIVLTLLVVSAMRMSKTNLKVVGNQQARIEATAAAQQAIEKVIGSVSNFYTPTAQTFSIDINNDGVADYTVQTAKPTCLQLTAADGYSVDFADSAPKDTYWDISAVATDNRSGVTVTVHQGARVRMNSTATCP